LARSRSLRSPGESRFACALRHHCEAQPCGRGDVLQAALAGSPSASPPGGPSPTTLGLVKQHRAFVLQLRGYQSFHSGYRPRYAHVNMSMRCRCSFFATSCPSASAVGTAPSAFAFGRLLPLASPPAGSSTVCHRLRQVSGAPWQTSARSANASEGGWRRLPNSAVAGSLRAAHVLCRRLVSQGSPTRSATTAWPNPRFEGTAEKLRFSVPRRLRRRAAPQA